MTTDDQDNPICPDCGGPGNYLGQLGYTVHFRCCNCGSQFSHQSDAHQDDMPDADKQVCRYCNGNCPNEPDDSEHLCDGFAGDVDNLYVDD